MNTPVSLEIDKLLLQKGIDMPVSPTIADVVIWLYKEHKVWIRCSVFEIDVFYPDIFDFNKKGNTAFSDNVHITFGDGEMHYNNPKEAYEAVY